MQYRLKDELLRNHNIENDLLDVDRMRTRSKSIDVLYSFDEDDNEVYLYDFIAYLFNSFGKVEDSNYDKYIINLFSNMKEDKIVFSREEFKKFFNYCRKLSISSKLKNIVCSMYIYNEAYIENKYFIESPVHDLSEVEVLNLINVNNLLFKEIKYLKKCLVGDKKGYYRSDEYVIDLKKGEPARFKVRRDAIYLNNEEIIKRIIKNNKGLIKKSNSKFKIRKKNKIYEKTK